MQVFGIHGAFASAAKIASQCGFEDADESDSEPSQKC